MPSAPPAAVRSEVLLETGRRIASGLELDETLRALGETLVPRFADWCSVHLLEAGERVRFATTYHADPALTARAQRYLERAAHPLDAPHGLGRTLRTGETQAVADLPTLDVPAVEREELLGLGVRSLVFVALRAHGHVVGALTVARGEGRPAFTHEDVLLLEDVAGRAAGAVESARLVAELRASEARLTAHNRALMRLARTSPHHAPDARASIRAIVEESARTLGVERVSAWIYDDARSRIRCIDLYEATAARHSAGAELAASDFPGYFEALAQERVIAAHDAPRDPRTREFAKSYLEPLGIASMLDAPLRVSGTVIGVLCHEHVGTIREWRPEEEIFAGALADLVSLAMEAERRLEAQEALAQARRELAHSEKLAAMGSLVSGVAHEIRTPLAYMANHSALLQAHARATRDETTLGHVAAILEGVDRVNGLVVDLRRFVRSERPMRAPASLADVAGMAARMFEATHRTTPVELDLAPTPELPLERTQVQQVVLNLLENAADASPQGAPVRLATRVHEGAAEIVVADMGAGIPTEVRAHMFEPFFTTKKDGTGLGLSIVRRICEAHGARVLCDATPGGGTTFVVSFPLGGA